MDSEIEKVIDESENVVEKEEMVQEGGVELSVSDIIRVGGTPYTLGTIRSRAYDYNINIQQRINDNSPLVNASGQDILDSNNQPINDRLLFLSDLFALLDPNSPMSAIFSKIPLAQYKHLPDPNYLLANSRQSGGAMDESTLPTQEVSLPPEPIQEPEEQLPSLDVVEPSSTGGSYKWSSHKKRKSTRIRTKKNKNKK